MPTKGAKTSKGPRKKKPEYPGVAKKKFCGPSGGEGARSYPVNTKKRCRAALAYARHAKKPEGIRSCVHRKCNLTESRN